MGLLDSVIGALAGGGSQGSSAGGGGQGALLGIVLGMLTNRGGGDAGAASGMGGIGGLGDLLAKFQQAGLGDAVASWVGTGQNMPVSGAQVEGALGTDLLSQIARQIGLPQGEVAGHLSQMLPQVVDRLTPNGQVPDGGVDASALPGFEGLGDLLGRFSK